WTGVQPAAMRFDEFIQHGAPVALLGVAVYGHAQRWLCHRRAEWGSHWRGLMLKMACWPVFLAGMLFAVGRKEIPYIPTAKEAQRGRFVRLAAPHLVLVALYLTTLGYTVYARLLLASEGALMLTAEAVWAMIGFGGMAA